MKNIKINEKLQKQIMAGGLSLVLVVTGFGLGRITSNNNISHEPNKTTVENVNSDELVNKYLKDYIAKRDELEKEINSLLERKENLKVDSDFYMSDLIVIENTNANQEPNLYILEACRTSVSGLYCEYHNQFYAWYKPLSKNYKLNPKDVYFEESQPLVNYLNDEELKRLPGDLGIVTTSELDEILSRIRSEYKQQLSKNTHSKKLAYK